MATLDQLTEAYDWRVIGVIKRVIVNWFDEGFFVRERRTGLNEIRLQVEGFYCVQVKLASTKQVLLQPSFEILLPSSHASTPYNKPFPHVLLPVRFRLTGQALAIKLYPKAHEVHIKTLLFTVHVRHLEMLLQSIRQLEVLKV